MKCTLLIKIGLVVAILVDAFQLSAGWKVFGEYPVAQEVDQPTKLDKYLDEESLEDSFKTSHWEKSINEQYYHSAAEKQIRNQPLETASNKNKNLGSNENELSKGINTCLSDKNCENVQNYPKNAIEKAIATKPLMEFFGVDPPEKKTVAGRSSLASEATSFCSTQAQIVYPKQLTSINGVQSLIVQNISCKEPGGVCFQGIKVVQCKENNSSCAHREYLPKGSITFCEQQYSYRRLLTYNASGNLIGSDIFPLPCGCLCKIVLRQDPARKSASLKSSIFDDDDDEPTRREMESFRKLKKPTKVYSRIEPNWKTESSNHFGQGIFYKSKLKKALNTFKEKPEEEFRKPSTSNTNSYFFRENNEYPAYKQLFPKENDDPRDGFSYFPVYNQDRN